MPIPEGVRGEIEKNIIMKKISLLVFAGLLLAACSSIPNKSVFEELTTDELASAIKEEPDFGNEYQAIRLVVGLGTFTDVEKAQFKDVTYRRLYKFVKHQSDSSYWASKEEKWGKEWDETMGNDLIKVDEKVASWNEIKAKNSLSRFAKIELSRFLISHYSYIGGVSDASICFNITPLQGDIEQIKFTYKYGLKIDDQKNQKEHKCVYSSPISTTTEGAWDIAYSERDKFDGITVEDFLQQNNLEIEITDVRKDGKNYSIEDLNIPEAITNFWKEDTPETRNAVALLINPSFVSRKNYIELKQAEEMVEYDSLCADFLNTALHKIHKM